MSETKHTPEPWFQECEGGGSLISSTPYMAEIVASGEGKLAIENARRIVACVNACAGIPTEDLERGYVHVKRGNVPHAASPFFCPNCGNAHDASIYCDGGHQ